VDVGTYYLADWAYQKADESCCPSWEDLRGGVHSKREIPGHSASSAVRFEGCGGSLGGFDNRIVVETRASAADCGCLAGHLVRTVEADAFVLRLMVVQVSGQVGHRGPFAGR
jgi:hypothetical protein